MVVLSSTRVLDRIAVHVVPVPNRRGGRHWTGKYPSIDFPAARRRSHVWMGWTVHGRYFASAPSALHRLGIRVISFAHVIARSVPVRLSGVVVFAFTYHAFANFAKQFCSAKMLAQVCYK